MTKYSRTPENPTKTCKARGSQLRVHFKNTRETAQAISHMKLSKAKKFLQDVIDHKQAVPFLRYNGGRGRHAQGKNQKAPGSQVGWPVKSCKFLLDLLTNAESNAEMKGLDVDELFVSHMQVNHAAKQRRRTYRAHGRIGPYMCNPSHIELNLTERDAVVKRAEDDIPRPRLTRKRRAAIRGKVAVGGGL